MCKILAKNIQLYDSWSQSEFSNFSDKVPGFSMKICVKFYMTFCITQLLLASY